MGLFGMFNKKEDDNSASIELLDKHDKGEINDEVFLKGFGKSQVVYSTPFGDHKDGGKRLFLLPGPDHTGYFPVFSSEARLKEFYEKVGRVRYAYMKGSFASVLETTKKVNADAPVKMGIIIDPGYYNVTVDVAALDVVIGMTK